MGVYHVFNDLEGLRIAVAIEQRGVDLYTRAGKIARDARAVAWLARLAADEQSHADTFQGLYEAAAAGYRAGGEGPAEYAQETNALLSALAADVVFPGGVIRTAVRAQGFENARSVLAEAIASEQNSISYYGECAALSRDEAARSAFERIMAEERCHLAELERYLEEEPPQG